MKGMSWFSGKGRGDAAKVADKKEESKAETKVETKDL